MQKEADARHKKFNPILVGIGLNTGDCSVGNMGSDQRFDYSVLGDDVNLASRLEGQSKIYGVDIVAGENTVREAGEEIAALEIDWIQVKGKTKPVKIFAVLGRNELKNHPDFRNLSRFHAEMLQAYRDRDWPQAENFLKQCRDSEWGRKNLFGLYGVYELYAGRIRNYRTSPPPAEWAGVYVASEK